jgi:Rieske Fe-S protein
MSTDGITRRQTLTGAAALGLATPLLAACGGDDGGGTAAEAPAAGEELGPTSDVPVGGGKIYTNPQVVVTQPTKGEFKGFTSICTHQGCPVSSVDDGTINCTCHGSKFNLTDGSVANPPAARPLPEKKITVDGNSIRLA